MPRKLQIFFFKNNSSVKIKNRTLFALLPLCMHSPTLPKLFSYYHIYDVLRPFDSSLTSCLEINFLQRVECARGQEGR